MSVIGGALGIALLNLFSRNGAIERCDIATAYIGRSKLEVLLGPKNLGPARVTRTCSISAAAREPKPWKLPSAVPVRSSASTCASDGSTSAPSTRRRSGVTDRCTFAREWREPVDVIVSLDSFEHFADPAGVLAHMRGLLRPGGKVLAAFGPTWYHPLGGHIYSVFPFSHLLFSERALVRWRSLHKADGATTIEESGLNKMTIRRFIELVEASPLRFASFELLPIRPLRLIANRLTREFTTAAVRCVLEPR